MSIGFASFKHLKLPISTKIPVNCLYLHDIYTTKFDFMNYAFAKLQLRGCKEANTMNVVLSSLGPVVNILAIFSIANILEK